MNTYINFSIQQLSDTLQIRLSSRPFKWTQLNIVLAGICTTVEKMKSTSTWILWAPTFFWCRKLSCVFVWGFYCCSTFNFIRDVTHRNRQCHVQDSLKLARRCAASSIYKCVCVEFISTYAQSTSGVARLSTVVAKNEMFLYICMYAYGMFAFRWMEWQKNMWIQTECWVLTPF